MTGLSPAIRGRERSTTQAWGQVGIRFGIGAPHDLQGMPWKPEGLLEFSPGMSEERAIPWGNDRQQWESKASASTEPQSRQQRLRPVLLASRATQRRHGFALLCFAHDPGNRSPFGQPASGYLRYTPVHPGAL